MNTPLTIAHNLRVLPVGAFSRFAIIDARAYVRATSPWELLNVSPGSVEVAETADETTREHTITCRIADDGPQTADMLARLAGDFLVACYDDEHHRARICGSPDYPLKLTYRAENGVYTLEFRGKDLQTNPYFEAI